MQTDLETRGLPEFRARSQSRDPAPTDHFNLAEPRRVDEPCRYIVSKNVVFDTLIERGWAIPSYESGSVPTSIRNRSLALTKLHALHHLAATEVTVPANPGVADKPARAWLEKVRCLEEQNGSRAAVRKVFEEMLALIEDAAFPTVDSILAAVAPGSFSSEVLLAFLAITSRVRDPLPSRRALFQRTFDWLASRREVHEAEALMRGLE